jgi:molybdopterin-guanine dinucleotide biosynthesis protein A
VKPFTAALIAGGRSSRMGLDKAFIDWSGRPLWEVQLARLKDAGATELLVCARRDQRFVGEGFRQIHDPVEGLGPLSGLANALRAATHDTVLVLAVDMPFITIELLRELIEQRLGSIPDGPESERLRAVHCIVPIRDGRFEALAAVYPKSALGLAEARLAGADRSLQGFCREAAEAGLVRQWVVPMERTREFRSVNSPEDLASA